AAPDSAARTDIRRRGPDDGARRHRAAWSLQAIRSTPASSSAERGGFEPPVPQGHTRFRVVPFQPGSRTSPSRHRYHTGAVPATSLTVAAVDGRERIPGRPPGTRPL